MCPDVVKLSIATFLSGKENKMEKLEDIRDFFKKCFTEHGESAEGVGWNSPYAQEIRFDQLLKVIDSEKPFTFLEFGCGYGHLVDYMRLKGLDPVHFYGYDILPESVQTARGRFKNDNRVSFHDRIDEIPVTDYLSASGVFNIKLDHSYNTWTDHIIRSLHEFDRHTARGFSVNFLTKYSDVDRMAARPDLYYADPCFLFDYCKTHFARNVALLHDYEIYDFTLIVRKEADRQID